MRKIIHARRGERIVLTDWPDIWLRVGVAMLVLSVVIGVGALGYVVGVASGGAW